MYGADRKIISKKFCQFEAEDETNSRAQFLYATFITNITEFHSRPAVGYFNFPENVTNMVKQFPLSRVAELNCWVSRRQSSVLSQTTEPQEADSEEPASKVTNIWPFSK